MIDTVKYHVNHIAFIPASARHGVTQAAGKHYAASGNSTWNTESAIVIVRKPRENSPWRADLGAMDTEVHLRRPVYSYAINPDDNYGTGIP